LAWTGDQADILEQSPQASYAPLPIPKSPALAAGKPALLAGSGRLRAFVASRIESPYTQPNQARRLITIVQLDEAPADALATDVET